MGAPTARDDEHDMLGLKGYGCLLTLVVSGLCGGGLLLVLGVGRVVGAGQGPAPEGGAEAQALVGSLETAVAMCGAGALALLVATVAGVVLLKELGDDAARRQRGPMR